MISLPILGPEPLCYVYSMSAMPACLANDNRIIGFIVVSKT